jgi:hypothetical protein
MTPMDGQTPRLSSMGLTLDIPTPAQAGMVLQHLSQAPSEDVVVIPDWPAQAWYHPALQAAADTVLLAGVTWHRARHTENHPYLEPSGWTARLLVFHSRPPESSAIKGMRHESPDLDAPPTAAAPPTSLPTN